MLVACDPDGARRLGARDVEQLKDNLAAVDLQLDAKAMASLDAVSEPEHGGYPYGAFGASQRSRTLGGSSNPAVELTRAGSDAPLGRA